MIVTTTPAVDGYRVSGYYGIVFGEVITGVNFLRDFGAGIRNIVGGRSEGYEQELTQARSEALAELEQRAAAPVSYTHLQQNKPPAAPREQGAEKATCGYLFLVEFGGRKPAERCV